jgi:NAD(P)-dependent dehydrogenase (short-subunit alcohol dehydrogenase family)
MGRFTSQDFWLFVAFLACLWYPVRKHFDGGEVKLSLLQKSLNGDVYVVTGGNTGIGIETVQQLAKQNATVIMASRSLDRGQSALKKVKAAVPYARVTLEQLDLESLESVRKFAAKVSKDFPKIKGLINNAGIMAPALSYTKEGFESQYGTNVLGHHLLTELLLPNLKAAAPSRIIDVASLAHEQANLSFWEDLPFWKKRADEYKSSFFAKWAAYGNTKLANILHARYLAKTLKGTGVSAVSLHPGVVHTELSRHNVAEWAANTIMVPFRALFIKNAWQGAQTTLHTALIPDSELVNGGYYSDCALKEVKHKEATEEMADKLYKLNSKLVGL